ncbi:non-homologous end-joining DNA ligase [Tepidibacillus fermentans]|uniref:Bifunctional non-homologous end joining protein LigD n=1 Tax=Tepidibacillus fermentans TaxID=1281767 RepID=A0A4V2UT52_9BACI|nr:non-homologous end-joining DNA ligase [Tepidibacillus fermentans]TCS84169.1 bifunctional non-homologous end joining protein LigD [Tepidibacillus fermentans]
MEIIIDNFPLQITNPEKIFWPEMGIRKIDYIMKLMELTPYLIPHAQNRLLTTIRYPDGIDGKSFYQKNIPSYAPTWVDHHRWQDTEYILLNKRATLAWLGNQAALEFHTAFNRYNRDQYPSSLVFDLDPSKGQTFEQVVEVALLIHETLGSLGLKSWIKTSGATGMQIYIPIGEKYTYEQARKMNEFFGKYFSEKYPQLITIERMVKKRESKLYFDYLQMWQGKTITLVYSTRATKEATVSTPIEWEELEKGIRPTDFHLLNIKDRIEQKGDLFAPLLGKSSIQNLDHILQFINKQKI